MKQIVILAGGKGTRLKDRSGDLPKPMIKIAGKPLLEHQIELARRYGFEQILILAAYRSDAIAEYFGDGNRWKVNITYQIEPEPLGTAGAVLAVFPELAEQFIVLYGDTLLNVDLNRLWQTHTSRCADVTLFLHPNDHPYDSDLVAVDSESWISAFHPRPRPLHEYLPNLVNAALYVINKSALEPWTSPARPMDFAKDLFPAMLRRGAKLLGYSSPEYIKDIGTPERYDRICAEYASGVTQRGSFATPQPAVFLDRDGTLNEEINGVTSPDHFRLVPDAAEAIHNLNHHGYRVVLLTNQPVVAKGWCTEADVQRIHDKLETLLGAQGAFLDRIYYCPHHPDKGFAGERPDLKMQCNCRKPAIGLIQRAVTELGIDLSQSWFVGDTTIDLQTAQNAGIKSILVCTGHAGKDGKFPAQPDFVCPNLKEAAQLILQKDPLVHDH